MAGIYNCSFLAAKGNPAASCGAAVFYSDQIISPSPLVIGLLNHFSALSWQKSDKTEVNCFPTDLMYRNISYFPDGVLEELLTICMSCSTPSFLPDLSFPWRLHMAD